MSKINGGNFAKVIVSKMKIITKYSHLSGNVSVESESFLLRLKVDIRAMKALNSLSAGP